VERFDHHCPWINNCVGINNHNYFILFVTSMLMLLALTFINAIMTLLQVVQNGYPNVEFWEKIKIPALGFFCLAAFQMAVSVLFFAPVFWLTCVQIGNFLANKTTIERYSRSTPSPEENQQRLLNSGITNDRRVIIDTYRQQIGSFSQNMR
jgi:hypothetical protein